MDTKRKKKLIVEITDYINNAVVKFAKEWRYKIVFEKNITMDNSFMLNRL